MGKLPMRHLRDGGRTLWVLSIAVLAGCAALPGVPPSAPHRVDAAPMVAQPPLPAQSPPGRAALPVEAPAASAEPTPPKVPSEPAPAPPETLRELQRGRASWYGPGFQGRRTASGERFDMHAMTAAHKTLPFGTVVRVRSLRTGREVDVRINDRGPYRPGYVIDVSRSAVQALGLLELGVKDVLLQVPSSTLTPADMAAPQARKAQTRRKPRGIRRNLHRGKPA